MIKWDEPIETVDERKARLIESNATEPGIWHIVYVSSIADPYGFGDVFIVNNEGFRCDDRAIYSKRQEPFIRNARVKREGWVRVVSNNGLPYSPGDVVYSEKTSAEAACQKLGGIPAFITWEK